MTTFATHPNSARENIFFVHGNLCSARFWEPAIKAYKNISGENLTGRVIAVDYPGCGKSSKPRQEDIHIEKLAERFIAVIEEQNLAPCHLIGHSAGGLIAAVMLAKKPELFKKTMLLDPVGAKGVAFNDVMLPTFEAMKVDKSLTATIIGSTIYQNNPEDVFFKNVIAEDAFTAVQNVGSWVLQALDKVDFTSLLKTIKKPLLVLHGQYDTLLPMHEAQEIATLVEGAKFEVIPDQGHCFNVENPPAFAEKLKSYLG